MLKFLFLLTALAALVLAQRDGCRQDYCDTVRCAPQREEICKEQNMDFIPYDPSICICCDTCVPYIPEGEKCGCDREYPISIRHCVTGTSCIDGTCKKQ